MLKGLKYHRKGSGKESSAGLLQQIGLLDEQGNIKQEVAETLKTVPQGAAKTVWAATSRDLAGIGGFTAKMQM